MYEIELQRYRNQKIKVCGKDSIPLLANFVNFARNCTLTMIRDTELCLGGINMFRGNELCLGGINYV